MPENKLLVVGLGYVGLPLAVLAREKGWSVTGLDINRPAVECINKGLVPFKDEELSAALQQYPVQATLDPAAAQSASHIVIAVPTPVTANNEPDLTPLRSALDSILPHLSGGQVLVVESTINPGVMDEVVVPLLQKRPDLPLEKSPNNPGAEPLYLAHCPERINPGDPKWSVRNIPRVLGGYSGLGARRAADMYASIIEAPIKIMGDATEAEAVKILENTFRDINIAFINEMARSFASLGIDIVNVINGAATKPFAFLPHYPGNGVGGHCISVDPYYMIARGREVGFDHKFLKLARQINEEMPAYTLELLASILQGQHKNIAGAKVALLGLAYKKNVSDLRNSPALKTLDLLQKAGAKVIVYDPYVPGRSNASSLPDALAQADIAILACDHDKLVKELTPALLKKHHIAIIIDAKNSLNHTKLSGLGIHYQGVGRGLKAS